MGVTRRLFCRLRVNCERRVVKIRPPKNMVEMDGEPIFTI